jgi:hypothetical protein
MTANPRRRATFGAYTGSLVHSEQIEQAAGLLASNLLPGTLFRGAIVSFNLSAFRGSQLRYRHDRSGFESNGITLTECRIKSSVVSLPTATFKFRFTSGFCLVKGNWLLSPRKRQRATF